VRYTWRLKNFFLQAIAGLTTTRRHTVVHFRRFLTVLEYSSIGVKFAPTTAPRTLYNVKKKKLKIFLTFFVLKVLIDINNFYAKTRFLIYLFKYVMKIFRFFYCRNQIRGHLVTTWEEKKFNFFSNSAFSVFLRFSFFICIWCYISKSIRNIWTI
jgi:hypothetical protein